MITSPTIVGFFVGIPPADPEAPPLALAPGWDREEPRDPDMEDRGQTTHTKQVLESQTQNRKT